MTPLFAFALFLACDGGRPELNVNARLAEDDVCATTPTTETICAGRATDMPIGSAEAAVSALAHTLPIAELGYLNVLVQDTAEQILAEQEAGLREPCLSRVERAETAAVIYEGSCAQGDGEAAWFEGKATIVSGEARSAARYESLSVGRPEEGWLETDGSWSNGNGGAVGFSADLRVSYDLGWEVPVRWTLVTQATGEGMTWHQVAWLQLDSDPEATALGAICVAADWDASETCADEADGTLTVVGASRWDLVSEGSAGCDACYEVARDCEPDEALCHEPSS